MLLKPKETQSQKEKERNKKKKRLKLWLQKNGGQIKGNDSKPFRLWSKIVKLRDKDCLMKGHEHCGGKHHAHHAIVEWAKSTACRYILDNGVRLCSHHHIWGVHRSGDPEFMKEYIKRLNKKVPIRKQKAIKKYAEQNKGKVWGYDETESLIKDLEYIMEEI